MLSVIEDYGHYRMAADLRACFADANPAFVRSVFLYGSASRFEAVASLSDLDVMVVLHGEVLESDQIATLSLISERVKMKHPIHMTFRIRNATDIIWSSSGVTDFGLSSLLNYLRDAWYLHGEDLDELLLARLKNSDEEEARNNLRLRLSEIRKRVRGLASVHGLQRSASNLSSPSKINYEIGDTLVELAEVLCYQHGYLFASTEESLNLATKITGSELFSYANSWKLGQAEVRVAPAVAEIDYLVMQAIDAGDIGFHRLLNSLVLERIAVAIPTETDQIRIYNKQFHDDVPLRRLIDELVSNARHCPLTLESNDTIFVHAEVRRETLVKHMVSEPRFTSIKSEMSQ